LPSPLERTIRPVWTSQQRSQSSGLRIATGFEKPAMKPGLGRERIEKIRMSLQQRKEERQALAEDIHELQHLQLMQSGLPTSFLLTSFLSTSLLHPHIHRRPPLSPCLIPLPCLIPSSFLIPPSPSIPSSFHIPIPDLDSLFVTRRVVSCRVFLFLRPCSFSSLDRHVLCLVFLLSSNNRNNRMAL
jgi:hypothetical protein